MRFFVALLLRMTPIYAVSGWTLIGFHPSLDLVEFYQAICNHSRLFQEGEDTYFLGDQMLINSVSYSD